MKIIQAFDGGKEKVYATKETREEALKLLNFIKSNFEQVIGEREDKLGFYGKADKYSTPCCFWIEA